jgi:Fic family protein
MGGKILCLGTILELMRLSALDADSLEKMYALIAEIDAVKKSWFLTKRLSPQAIERLTHSVIVTSAGASNRIEGNKLTDEEVETLYKNLRIKKLKSRDQQEVAGYLEVLGFIFKKYKDIPVTESSILTLQNDMLAHSEKDTGQRGRYKVGSNRVEARDDSGNLVGVIFDPTPPYLVPKEMHELVDWYHWALDNKIKHPLIVIANFIFEFLANHPFQDGNGRTSRLLSNLMLLQNDYHFTSLVSHEKIIESHKLDYYTALNKSQQSWKTGKEDITPWILFFLSVVKTQAVEAMDLLEHGNIENFLSPKQLVAWQWILQNQSTECSRKDVVEALGFPERTVEEIIKKLLGMRRIARLGEGKATRYKLVQ